MTHISIIIPTLNEEKHISQTIELIRQKAVFPSHEIIVVDSGSSDGTNKILQQITDIKFYQQPEFMGLKYAILNFGASMANGEVLFFLDADSYLPAAYDQKILSCLNQPGVIAGAFDLKLSPENLLIRFIAYLNKIRYRNSKNFYGDQGLFIRKNDFLRSGGYPEQPLMEAAYYCRKLKKLGKLKVVSQPIVTSSRRFIDGGILQVLAKDLLILLLFNLRIPVERFAKKYWHYNSRKSN